MRSLLPPPSCLIASICALGLAGCNDPSTSANTETSSSDGTSDSGTDSSNTDSGTDSTTDGDPDAGTGDGDGEPEPTEPVGTSVLIKVTDLEGNGIELAQLHYGDQLLTTDGAGYYLFQELPEGWFKLKVEAAGHTPAVVSLDLGGGDHTFHELQLMPRETITAFNANIGADLELSDIRIDIPANAVATKDGVPVTGQVDIAITTLDPTTDDIDALPGPLHGRTADNEDVFLQTLAMAEISLWQNGQELQLAEGSYAILEFVIPDALQDSVELGDKIPAWYLDLDAGIWGQEGEGTIVAYDGDPAVKAWKVEVEHFSWWNCDTLLDWSQAECFVVTARQDGELVPQSFTMLSSFSGLQPPLVDGASSKLTDQNVGGNCVMGVSNATKRLAYKIAGETFYTEPVTGTPGLCRIPAFVGEPNPACTVVNVDIPVTNICTPGSSLPCEYDPDNLYPGTEDVGICRAGLSYCEGPSWSSCDETNVYPFTWNGNQVEICDTYGIDDDCTGDPNGLEADAFPRWLDADGAPTIQPAGADGCEDCHPNIVNQPCYFGPPGTLTGTCEAGTYYCEMNTFSCLGQIDPQPEEACEFDDGMDENCDGVLSSCERVAWVKGLGTVGDAYVYDLAYYNQNSTTRVYAAGSFSSTLVLDENDAQQNLATDSNSTNIFIAQFNAPTGLYMGDTNWALSLGVEGQFDQGFGVAADGNGSAYVAGAFRTQNSPINFDPEGDPPASDAERFSNGDSDIFVTKYQNDGGWEWARTFGGPAYDAATDIIYDDPRVVVSATVSGNPFGEEEVTPGTNAALIVLERSNDGETILTRSFLGAGNEYGQSVAADASENIVFTGYFDVDIDLDRNSPGSQHFVAEGTNDAFVVKFNIDGNLLWSLTLGGEGALVQPAAVDVDSYGDIYLAGRFAGTINDANFDPSFGSYDGFIAKLNGETGAIIWADTYGNVNSETVQDVHWTNFTVFVTGRYRDLLKIDPDPNGLVLPVFGGYEIYLAKYTDDGSFQWAQGFGGTNNDDGFALAGKAISQPLNQIDPVDTGVYVGGHFSGQQANFKTFDQDDPILLNSTGVDGFVLKNTF